MARMLATFLLLLSLGTMMFNHAEATTLSYGTYGTTSSTGTTSTSTASSSTGINDCSDVVDQSGVYTVIPCNIQVFCEAYMEGGWTVFQRRYDGSVDFFRGWDDYVNGFGSWYGEFWLGLEKLHQLTRNGNWRMRVQLSDWNGKAVYAEYDSFYIGDAASNYQLNIGGYSGTAGDSMSSLNGWGFTTKDKDNDEKSYNCAEDREGAWWYKGCTYSNLNGKYLGQASTGSDKGLEWKNDRKSRKSTTMMIRPAPSTV